MKYLKLMRVNQYTKNAFIFAPAFFAFGAWELGKIWGLFVVAFGFCLVCSAIYVINDVIDKNADKLHPSKKNRPIASGAVSVKSAIVFACVLLVSGLLVVLFYAQNFSFQNLATQNFALDSQTSLDSENLAHIAKNLEIAQPNHLSAPPPPNKYIIFAPIIFYIFLNLLYSLALKNIAIIDIFIIALGFVLRLVIGSLVIGVALSYWIVIVTFLLALFLALAKRRDDCLILESSGQKMRQNIEGYNRTFLDIAMSISASLVLVAHIFYSIDDEVAHRFGTQNLYITSLFVLLGILRYMQITFVLEKSANPSKILLKDKFLQGCILAYVVSFMAISYFKF